jgi:hypothetical protein
LGNQFPRGEELKQLNKIAVVIEERLGRTEFQTSAIESEAKFRKRLIYESDIVLFYKCTRKGARRVLKTANTIEARSAPTRLGRRAYLVKKVNIRSANLP